MNDTLLERIAAARDYIGTKAAFAPETGIILGSGLGALTASIETEAVIPYREIPFFPASTVQGHQGNLILGTLAGKKVVAMAGRFHYYEGYTMQELSFPVRVMKAMGIHTLLLSNAAGGMNPAFRVGDLMIIADHINLLPEHPLRGPNEDSLGPRFPDMSEPYDGRLIALAEEIAREQGFPVHKGVYAAVQGPSFETRAEYRYLNVIGADAVGMSTVPETIVAIHAGLKVFAMSVITDLGIREENNIITHQEVLDAAEAAAPKLTLVFRELVRRM